jgi:hypothetical protein
METEDFLSKHVDLFDHSIEELEAVADVLERLQA